MKRSSPSLAAVLAFGAFVTPVLAHPYVIGFSGTVDVANGNDTWGALWGGDTAGDVWLISLRVESETVDTDGSASQGRYTGAITDVTLEIEAVSFSTLGGPGTITVVNDVVDTYTVQFELKDGLVTYPVTMSLSDSTGTVFTSDALPLCDALDPLAFDASSFSLTLSGSAGEITGSVEPSDFSCDTDCNANDRADSLDSYLGGWFCVLGCSTPCSNGAEYSVALELGRADVYGVELSGCAGFRQYAGCHERSTRGVHRKRRVSGRRYIRGSQSYTVF